MGLGCKMLWTPLLLLHYCVRGSATKSSPPQPADSRCNEDEFKVRYRGYICCPVASCPPLEPVTSAELDSLEAAAHNGHQPYHLDLHCQIDHAHPSEFILGATKHLMAGDLQPSRPIPCGMWHTSTQELHLEPPLFHFDHCQIVVYTQIIAGYDAPHRWHRKEKARLQTCFVIFMDTATLKLYTPETSTTPPTEIEGWQVIEVKNRMYEEGRKGAKYFKHIPYLFRKAIYAIHVDSKLTVYAEPEHLLIQYLLRPEAEMAMLANKFTVNPQEEQDFIVNLGLAREDLTQLQFARFRQQGFDPTVSMGMVDSMLLLRDLRSPSIAALSCAWFAEVAFNPRDQFSFNYIIHNLGYNAPEHLTPDAFDSFGPCEKMGLQFQYTSPLLNHSRIHLFPRCQMDQFTRRHQHIVQRTSWHVWAGPDETSTLENSRRA